MTEDLLTKHFTKELIKRGISEKIATKLFLFYKEKYPNKNIIEVLKCFDYLEKQNKITGSKQASLLVVMIKTNTNKSPGYNPRKYDDDSDIDSLILDALTIKTSEQEEFTNAKTKAGIKKIRINTNEREVEMKHFKVKWDKLWDRFIKK